MSPPEGSLGHDAYMDALIASAGQEEEDEPEEDRPPTWTTKDGRTMLVSDMESSHIENTLRLFARSIRALALHWSYRASLYACTAPEAAADCADRESAELLDIATEPCCNTVVHEGADLLKDKDRAAALLAVEAEAERRGLYVRVDERECEALLLRSL